MSNEPKLSERLRSFALGLGNKIRSQKRDELMAIIMQAEALEAREPVAECEAMCRDHGGIEGCSCSECSTPLGPRELCAYCNGCGRRVKWPMADGTEYRAPIAPLDRSRMPNETSHFLQVDIIDDTEDCIAQAEALEAREPKVMTDGEIEQFASDFLQRNGKFMTMIEAIRYARDNGYLAPLDRSRMVEALPSWIEGAKQLARQLRLDDGDTPWIGDMIRALDASKK